MAKVQNYILAYNTAFTEYLRYFCGVMFNILIDEYDYLHIYQP